MPLKLLDYVRPNPFGEIIGKPRNLAWPVNAYRVTLPGVSEDGDGQNPFERVLLKMIDAGGAREVEALARETGIPFDLVQCVLLRLRDKAFIDEHNEIIKQKRDNWNTKEDEPSVYVTALLFRELATGKILPFLHVVNDDKPLKTKEDEKKCFRKIRYDEDHKNTPPISREVISALRAMKKRSIAYGVESRLPPIKQISIVHEPEQYYLDCPIAIQKCDSKFRIADPFGNGFSLVLENAFGRLLEQDNRLSDWLMNWMLSLSNPRPDKPVVTQKEPFDNSANWGRYPKLLSSLLLREDTQYRSIQKIHASLEWALFYACAKRPYDTVVKQLKLTHQSDQPKVLENAANIIGLGLTKYGFRQVLVGKLDDFLSGETEMGTVLSIALLMAESDAAHPLRLIASKHKDFIIRIFDIKNKRDAQGHGKGKVQKNEVELSEDAFMREIVSALLPDIRFSDTPVQTLDKDAAADVLLDARTNIQCEFGFGLFNRLGMELQDRLIYVERYWLSYKDGDDALTFVCDIYAALQMAFRQKLAGVLSPEIEDSEFVVTAQMNASRGGLGRLPDVLSTVKTSAIRNTLQGNDQTLGACVIAFLLVSDDDTLAFLANTQPSFLFDVKSIINLRGHGNQPLPIGKDSISKLRKSTYTTIKTLQEI